MRHSWAEVLLNNVDDGCSHKKAAEPQRQFPQLQEETMAFQACRRIGGSANP